MNSVRFCTSADGTRIAWTTSGSGPPLLWVQHWVHQIERDEQNLIWKPWIDHLSRRRTLIRYDWRGCGLSDRGVEHSFQRYADDLAAVAEAVAFPSFAVFAMAGAGCAAALRLACLIPTRISGLILYAPHTRGRLTGAPEPNAVAESEARLKVIEMGWGTNAPGFGDFFSGLHLPDAPPTHARSFRDLGRTGVAPQAASAMLRAFWEVDLGDMPAAVTCPTLVLHAKGDAIIPFEEGAKVARMIRSSELLPLESRNHILVASDPAWTTMVKAVDSFLAKEPGAIAGTLSDREQQVLDLLLQGAPTKVIAEQLAISEKTARNHVSNLVQKSGAGSRGRLIAMMRPASR